MNDTWTEGAEQVVDPGGPDAPAYTVEKRPKRTELTDDERIERDHQWVQYLYESPRGLAADY